MTRLATVHTEPVGYAMGSFLGSEGSRSARPKLHGSRAVVGRIGGAAVRSGSGSGLGGRGRSRSRFCRKGTDLVVRGLEDLDQDVVFLAEVPRARAFSSSRESPARREARRAVLSQPTSAKRRWNLAK